MKNKHGMTVFDNCVICNLWRPVTKGPDGKNYCSMHLPEMLDETKDKITMNKSEKRIEDIRKGINGPQTNNSHYE